MISQGVPDDVPEADAAEQQRDTAGPVPDDEAPVPSSDGPPLEAPASDWQEQREAVDQNLNEFDDEFDRGN